MTQEGKKRYLITYSEGGVTTEQASGMLNLSSKPMLEGVEFMATDALLTDADVLHFENLGVTNAALTQDERESISQLDGVLAVEEDVEMFAIDKDLDFVEESEFSELVASTEEVRFELETVFQDGYDQALIDIFASMLRMQRSGNGAEEAAGITPVATQPIPWNIKMVKAPIAWRRGITGRGVKVAVLDTGISAHADLVIRGGVSFVPGVSSYHDGHGHGTHCAGIVAARNNAIGVVGVAPDAQLYAVKVLSDAGRGNSSWIIAGMEWCIRNKMHIASMSLGGLNGPITAYANAVKRCQDKGITVVIAAGNSFEGDFPWVGSPANSILVGQPNASPIAVAAIDSRGVIARFSSRGGQTAIWNQVTCSAPGVAIRSTFKEGGYATFQGTSMACPHVAGYAALLYQRFPRITPAGVKAKIKSTSLDLGPVGFDKAYGYGLINCDKAAR